MPEDKRKNEAAEYVRRCLTGELPPQPINARLSIPEDITGSIKNLHAEYREGHIVGTLYLGKLFLKPYYPRKEWGESAYTDLSSDYMKYVVGKLCSGLCHSAEEETDLYYMLKPTALRLEKDKEGKYRYICCDIEYSRDGQPRTVSAESITELGIRLEYELDKLMAGSSELLEYKARSAPMQFKTIMANSTDTEQEQLWRLIGMAVTGSGEEQLYARDLLRKKCYGLTELRAKERQLINGFEEAEKESEENAETFQGYLSRAIDRERLFTENSLAEKIGCSASTISRVRSGKIKQPRKRLVMQIGAAIGLSAADLGRFIRSSGHNFPVSKADVALLDCLESGLKDYDKIMYEVSKFDPDLYKE